MNNEELVKEISLLKEELQKTKYELLQTQEHLKKYTAPSNMKKYYENHKEEIKAKAKEYKQKTDYYNNLSSEKKKEYARKAYLKRKEKIEKEKIEKNTI